MSDVLISIGGVPIARLPSAETVTDTIHANEGFLRIAEDLMMTPVVGNSILILMLAAVSIYIEHRLRQRNKEKLASFVKLLSYLLGGIIFIDAFLDAGDAVAKTLMW